uniref:Uncharacterized protein n=1 Tax=Arion vulgaris TaxID=1028688 RepID=A0A0B7B3B5_9EUPU
MQSYKSVQGASGRRASAPVPVNLRHVTEPTQTSNTTTTISAATLLSSTITPAALSASTEGTTQQVTADYFTPPLVMTPVSRLPKGPRRNSRAEVPASERPATWDPEHYNPDGSLRTMHKLPGFDQSYAQAMKARYIRHKDHQGEKELSIREIFEKKD